MRLPTGPVLVLGAAILASCASGGGRDAVDETPQFLMSADALLFVGFDADRDLKVSNAEVDAGVTAAFAAADQNSDGKLQAVEFATWSANALGGTQMPPYRLEFDRNVDNEITAEEFRTELLARAKEYDRDEDGVIARLEFLRPAPGAGALRRRAPNGGGPPQDGMPPPRR